MRLHRRIHPRRADWSCYECDVCSDTYWAKDGYPVGRFVVRQDGGDRCESCRSSDPAQFTSGRDTEADKADREFHGDRFTQGEW